MPITVSSSSTFGRLNRLNESTRKLGQNLNKLGSGLRITGASDDAAGLAVAENLRAQITSLDQAARNVSEGSSLLRTAEGALSQIGGLLDRARELAVQASTGTISGIQRRALNREFIATLEEINQISTTTEFNGLKLLTGSLGPSAVNPVTIQAGTGATEADMISIDAVEKTDTQTLGLENVDIATAENARNAITAIDNSLGQVTSRRSAVGVLSNRLEISINSIAVARENLLATEEQIRGVDYSRETSDQRQNEVIQQAGISSLQKGLSQQENLIGSLLNLKG